MNTVTEAMQKLATPEAKREYAATCDKYLFAKDTLEGYLNEDVFPIVSESMIDAFEEMLEAK